MQTKEEAHKKFNQRLESDEELILDEGPLAGPDWQHETGGDTKSKIIKSINAYNCACSLFDANQCRVTTEKLRAMNMGFFSFRFKFSFPWDKLTSSLMNMTPPSDGNFSSWRCFDDRSKCIFCLTNLILWDKNRIYLNLGETYRNPSNFVLIDDLDGLI